MAVYPSLSHHPFNPTMLAEVDKLGLLVEGTQPSCIPSILQYAAQSWRRRLALWTKKLNDFQKGSRPNSGPICIFLENEVGL